ncbi:MAG: sensor histidine kinase [Lachnospiraceae bacterium]|nr:sensor histidine kinase [Lachnospiraceae bacterium]
MNGIHIILAAVIAILLILLILAGVKLYRQKKIIAFLTAQEKRKKTQDRISWESGEAEEVRLLRKRMELSTLQEQINPHFLYNTLDSIRSRALMDGQTEIAQMTEILSRFFRYCISNNDSLVRVREELNHIQDYYYIQKYRFEDKLDMRIEVETEEIYDYYLPKMTLQPLVENAMIHGLEKSAKKGRIDLHIFLANERLVILVADNGVGMSPEQLTALNERMSGELYEVRRKGSRHTGIALNNVNTRLKLTFGEDSGIHYRSMEGEGTDAVVTMPVVDVFARVRYEEKSQV